MNCQRVRQVIAAWRTDSPEESGEFAAEVDHLRSCPACRAQWTRQQANDQILSRAIRNVAVPDDLKSRLLTMIAQATPTSLSPTSFSAATGLSAATGTRQDFSFASDAPLGAPAPTRSNAVQSALPVTDDSSLTSPGSFEAHQPAVATGDDFVSPTVPNASQATQQKTTSKFPSKSDRTTVPDAATIRRRAKFFRRTAWRGVCAAVVLLGLGLLWWGESQPPTVISIRQLLASTQSLESSSAAATIADFQGTFQPNLPVYDIRLPAGLGSIPPKSLQYLGQEVGAIYSFDVDISAPQPATAQAVLMVVKLNALKSPELESLQQSFRSAPNQYPPPKMYATRIWRDPQFIYVFCVQSRDPNVLERMQARSFAG